MVRIPGLSPEDRGKIERTLTSLEKALDQGNNKAFHILIKGMLAAHDDVLQQYDILRAVLDTSKP